MQKDNKTFKYQGKGVDSKGATKAKAPKGSRVRIQAAAGDKCVAPVKSKPKKRKTVNQPDYSTLSMDHVEWSEQSFSVTQLTQHYGSRFPILVRVLQGYYGDFGMELSKDQVLQIHSFGKQRRAVATDSQQRSISIPYDYPIQVYLPETKEKMTFAEALSRYPLPLSIEVQSMSPDVQLTNVNLNGEPLYVRKVLEDVFLRANSINGGWINQKELLLVPSFLGAQFTVAVGMRSASLDEWCDYQNMFARSVRHLMFNLITGYSGIVMTDTETPSPYRGSKGIQFRYSVGDMPTQEDVKNTHAYQNVIQEPISSQTQTQAQTPNNKMAPAPQLYENLPSNQGGQLYENLPSTGPSSVQIEVVDKGHGILPDVAVQAYSTVAPHYGGSKQRESTSDHPNESFDTGAVGTGGIKYAYDNHAQIEEAEVHPEPSRSGTPFSEIDENDIPDMFNRVIQVGQESMEREKRMREQNLAMPGSHHRTDLDEPVPPPLPYRSSTQDGRAVNVVPPTVKAKPSKHHPKPSPDGKSTLSKIECMDDVPSTLESLTVADVCKCLALLNMDTHVDQFRQHQVDGKLLSDLKDTVMINEFNFTPFNASKLCRFIRGWRPKVV